MFGPSPKLGAMAWSVAREVGRGIQKKAGNWAAWTVALRFAHTLSVMKLKWLIDTQTDSKRPYCDNGVFWDGRSKTLKARGSAFAVNYGSVIPKTTSKEKQKAVRSKNIVQYTH